MMATQTVSRSGIAWLQPLSSYIPSKTMRILFLVSLLTFAYSYVAAYLPPEPTDISEGVPAAKINTMEQGSNVIVKLDCSGCSIYHSSWVSKI
jgi:hypothetical protein